MQGPGGAPPAPDVDPRPLLGVADEKK